MENNTLTKLAIVQIFVDVLMVIGILFMILALRAEGYMRWWTNYLHG